MRKIWTKESVIKRLQDVAIDGKIYTKDMGGGCANAATKIFGNLDNARKEANVEPKILQKKWTKEKMIKHIQKHSTDGKMYYDDISSLESKSCYHLFGSMAAARKAAGVELICKYGNYTLNENLYSKNSKWTDEKAWLAGLLWSDGYIQGNRVNIDLKDLDALECVKNILDCTLEPKKIYKKQPRWKLGGPNKNKMLSIYVYRISSKQLSNDLRRVGMYENKTLTIDYPKELPDKYFGSFFRGLIDGDGCVRMDKYTGRRNITFVTASLYLKNSIIKKLNKYNINFYVYCESKYWKNNKINKNWHGNDLFVIRIASNSFSKLYGLMYPDLFCPCLKRKRDAFEQIIKKPDRAYIRWSKKDKEILRGMYCNNYTLGEICKQFPNRTKTSIKNCASKVLGLRRKKP